MANNAQSPSTGRTTNPSRATTPTRVHGRQADVRPLLSPFQTEGVILRMAGVLSADAALHPGARKEHLAYINGALSVAASLGVLSDERALAVRTAAINLFDSATRPARERAAADPAFAQMISAVRRKGGASLRAPLPMAELGEDAARAMLGRLMAAGVIGAARPGGFHPITAGEC